MKKQDWTFVQSLLLLFVLLDITIIVIWLVIYPDYYDTLAKVVSGTWGAVITVLTYFKIKQNKEISFNKFIDLLPVRIIIIVYTFIIFIFTLLEFPVHYVSIYADVPIDGKPVEMRWIDNFNDSTKKVELKNTSEDGEWKIWPVKKESYTIICKPAGYKEIKRDVSLGVLPFHSITIEGFKKTEAKLKINYSPEEASLTIINTIDNEEVDKNNVHQKSPWLVDISNGSFKIIAKKDGYKTDSSFISIEQDEIKELSINLVKNIVPQQLGKLKINTNPMGMKVYINGVDKNITTPCTLELPPADDYHLLLKKKKDDQFGYLMEKPFDIKNAKTTKVDTQLYAIRLFSLTIMPQKSNFTYYIDNKVIKSIGETLNPFTIQVFPGESHITKKNNNTGEIYSIDINVSEATGTIKSF